MRSAFGGVDRGEDFARESRAAAYIEDHGGGVEVEEFEGAVGHGGLNVLDSRGCSVFACFGVIVMEIGGAVVLC